MLSVRAPLSASNAVGAVTLPGDRPNATQAVTGTFMAMQELIQDNSYNRTPNPVSVMISAVMYGRGGKVTAHTQHSIRSYPMSKQQHTEIKSLLSFGITRTELIVIAQAEGWNFSEVMSAADAIFAKVRKNRRG